MRLLLMLVRMVLRRIVGLAISLLIWVIFGRSRMGRNVKMSLNLLRRFARF